MKNNCFLFFLVFLLLILVACQNKTQENNMIEGEKHVLGSENLISNSIDNIESFDPVDDYNNGTPTNTILIAKQESDENQNMSLIPSNIEKALISLEVFETNDDIYSNKFLTLNGITIGRIPPNNHAVWKEKSITLSKSAMSSLTFTNSIGIIDKTGDLYNIRNITLKYQIKGSQRWYSSINTNAFSSGLNWWPLKQGETIKLDGSPFVLINLF